MNLAKAFAMRVRVRSLPNRAAFFGAGPKAANVRTAAPLTLQLLRDSDPAFLVESEISTLAQIIRSVPGALCRDCGYDEGARTTDRGLYVPRNLRGSLVPLPVRCSF